jgi:CRP/FNR family transcriptional regulator, cyclic AMP receptor protein
MQLQAIDIIGFAASGLVFLTFYMRTLLSLRLVAIVSNIFFAIYGLAAGLVPILVLHLLLLPMNTWRAVQLLRTRKRMRAALEGAPGTSLLLPLMTTGKFREGEVIFRRGDPADRLYIVLEGEVLVEEFDKTIRDGDIFGEIGLFSVDAKRTATVSSKSAVTLAWADRETILRVYRDHPDFALALTKLIASRLTENQNELLAGRQPQA